MQRLPSDRNRRLSPLSDQSIGDLLCIAVNARQHRYDVTYALGYDHDWMHLGSNRRNGLGETIQADRCLPRDRDCRNDLFIDHRPEAKATLARYYTMALGISLENVAIAVILLYVIFRHTSPVGIILNWRPIRHFGIISYSLYLWQQLFTGPQPPFFPLNILCIVACAELLYLLVERPSLRLRNRLERTFDFFHAKTTP